MKVSRNCPKWVGEAVSYSHGSYSKKTFYSEFKFGSVQGKVGRFVLISNADAVHPDTPEGCDVAEIIKLYETADDEDPYRAVVRWFSRPQDVPKRTIKSLQLDRKVEVILDERPFDNDVNIETFFSNCVVIGAKVDVDPVTEAKKIEGHVRVPVFVCRYKLVGSGRSAKIEPYLCSDETEVNKYSFKSTSQVPMIDSSGESVAKQNKSYEPLSSKAGGIMKIHLKIGKHSFPSDHDTESDVLETNREKERKECNGNICKCESNLSPVKRINIHRVLENDSDDLPIEGRQSKRVKTKASEAMHKCTSFVPLKMLNLKMDGQEDSPEDGNRSCSPVIPFTEPSMRWYGMKDNRNDLRVLKIPIKACDPERKPLKSIAYENTQPSVKKINLKDIGDLTSGEENEIESITELGRKVPFRYEEKKCMNNVKPEKSDKCGMLKEEELIETKNFTYKKKLKDKDISQLLDDDETSDTIFVPKKATDKPKSELKSSHCSAGEESESAVLHVKKTSKANITNVGTKQIQGGSGTSCFTCADRVPRGSNNHKCESKGKMNSIKSTSERSKFEKGNSDLSTTLASLSMTEQLEKQHPEQWSGNIEGCTRLKAMCRKSLHVVVEKLPLKNCLESCGASSLSTPGSTSVVTERHSLDDKVTKLSTSQPGTCRSKHLNHASAKKKLSYEDSGTKRKLSCGESLSRCDVTDTSLALKDERTEGQEELRNGRTELSTLKFGCTSDNINNQEPVHNSDNTDCYLESKGPVILNHWDLLQKREDHWTSVLDSSDGDVSSCSSSVRLKLCRTNRYMNCDNDQEFQDTTPKRRKRQIFSASDSDSDCEEDSTLRSKRYKTHEPCTPKSVKTEQKASPCVRSSSRKLKPNKWYGSDWISPTTTPVCSLKRQVMNGSPVTPKALKPGVTQQAPTTPVSKRGSARCALLTPSVPTRASSVSTPGSVLEEARARLHVAAVPKSLPCREKEFDNIYRFIEGKILDGAGGCMYISGVPGTGKTATVKEVVHSLQEAVSQRDIPDFQFIELNGMWLTEPRQVYVQLLNALTGQTVTTEQAQQLLERRFSRTAHRRITTLLLVDELDLLWTRRQDVVYNLLDWPTKTASRLVVLTIANTMDLPERLLMGRVTSRLGLTRVTFHPYTHRQLQEIVMARLTGLQAFDPDAVQLVARKVAAVSGDARRALDICRRATELAERDMEDSEGMVTMQHVDQALGEMIASTKVQAIRYCSKMEQLFLQAVAAEIQRTGVEETIFEKVYVQLKTLCIFDGYTVPSVTESLGLCARLGSCRLLLTEHSRMDVYQRVLLNVSSDDIYYALKV